MGPVVSLLQYLIIVLLLGMVMGIFPLIPHVFLLRLTAGQRRWTRWMMPVLVALYVGRRLLLSQPQYFLGWAIHLGAMLVCEGMLLLCTRYMEQNSK